MKIEMVTALWQFRKTRQQIYEKWYKKVVHDSFSCKKTTVSNYQKGDSSQVDRRDDCGLFS